MSAFLYILASKANGTLYVGVSNNLLRRVYEHRENMVDGFTKKYGVKRLVYYEEHETMPLAIQREKNVKHWVRKWKIELIEKNNPDWADLWEEIGL
ncbi:MAG: GIY-YIG nuclease family protein [Devosiaceae bacterium]|nr:GIY-YIG nuclease family protein [Devosiaceae bacterium]